MASKKKTKMKKETTEAVNKNSIHSILQDSKNATNCISIMNEFGISKSIEHVDDELCFGCHSY